MAATESAWPEVRRAFGWVHRAAAILRNKKGLAGVGVRRRFRRILGAIARHRRSAGVLEPAISHLLKATRSYWPGLFACYDTDGLPRTNNALEQLFGSYPHHERRASGRKVASPGMVVRGLVRRAWAMKGHTPKLMSFGRHRDKVSTIAAIVVTPGGRRVRLFWHTDAEHYVAAAGVVAFLRKLLAQLRGRVIVVWDGGSNHKGPLMRGLLAEHRRLHLERLPAYAPDLNPVEMIWSYLKYDLMANFVPRDVHEVDKVVQGHLLKLGKDPKLIRALWTGSRLPPINENLPS